MTSTASPRPCIRISCIPSGMWRRNDTPTALPATTANALTRVPNIRVTYHCNRSQAKLGSTPSQRLDHKIDVLVERHAQVVRATEDVLAIYPAGERFVLHLFLDRGDVDYRKRPARLHQSHGNDKAHQLIHPVQGFLHVRLAGHAGVVGVGQDRPAPRLRHAAPSQLLHADQRMPGFPRWTPFVVEIVHQAHSPPDVLILAKPARIGPHLLGTAECRRPEQAGGGPRDERSDIYTLGVVACYAPSGRPPFEGPVPMTVLAQHVTDPAPPRSSVAPAGPRRLAEIVDRCR